MEALPTLVKKFSKTTNYTFTNPKLLQEALTHPSAVRCRENVNEIKNCERLEFLGDAVLNFVVSDMVFRMYPDDQEGQLTRRRKHLVDGKTITEIARNLNVCDLLITGNGGKCNPTSLENAVEALIGAIYIDSGFETAKDFVLQYWEKLAREREDYVDPKTALQEWALKNRQPLPNYRTIKEVGPPHNRTFTVRANVYYLAVATATDKSKKKAQTKAAEILLQKLSSKENKNTDSSSETEFSPAEETSLEKPSLKDPSTQKASLHEATSDEIISEELTSAEEQSSEELSSEDFF